MLFFLFSFALCLSCAYTHRLFSQITFVTLSIGILLFSLYHIRTLEILLSRLHIKSLSLCIDIVKMCFFYISFIFVALDVSRCWGSSIIWMACGCIWFCLFSQLNNGSLYRKNINIAFYLHLSYFIVVILFSCVWFVFLHFLLPHAALSLHNSYTLCSSLPVFILVWMSSHDIHMLL